MSDETRQLAEFTHDLQSHDLPHDIHDRLRVLVLDNLASGFLGTKHDWYAIAAESMIGLGAGGKSGVFGRSDRFDCSRATFLNGIAIGGFEADHVGNGAHTGASVFPAIFALGEAIGASGESFLRAMAAGYEVNCRVVAAQTNLAEQVFGFHNPAISGVFASAAACAALLGLSVEQTLSALGIAGSSSAGLNEYVWGGEMTKRLHLGRSTQLGLEAALLAKEGFTGPPTIFEGQYGYLQAYSPEPQVAELVKDLGSRWYLEGQRVKPFPADGTSQPFLPGLAEWSKSGDPSSIERVEIKTSSQGIEERFLDCVPQTLLGAQYSIPFMVGLVLTRGIDGLIELNETMLNDSRVLRLAKLVTIAEDARFTGHIMRCGGEVTLTVNGAPQNVPAPGIPDNSIEELKEMCSAKFSRYTQGLLSESRVAEIEKLVGRLDEVPSVAELAALVFPANL